MMNGEAVLEAVRPAGVLGHVPADGADNLTRRIRGIEQAVRLGRLADGEVGDARLHDRATAGRVDRHDAPHLGHHDEDTVRAGQRAAGQPGAAAPGHERNAPPTHARTMAAVCSAVCGSTTRPGLHRWAVRPSHS